MRSLVLMALLATAGLIHADPLANLVVNGGFETGTFSGWTLSGNATACVFVGIAGDTRCVPSAAYGGRTGLYAAELGNYGADAVLSQVISTTVGSTYEVSFWLASQSYGTPSNDFSVTWGGTTLLNAANLSGFGYTQYDFTGLTAAGSSTVLTFAFHNNPSYFALDDISVVDPVPEPLGAGFAGLLSLVTIPLVLRRRECR